MALTNRLAIIAGGLGGLGTATGRLLREQGARLALLYAPFEAHLREQTLASSFESSSPSDIDTYECDIAKQDSVHAAFQRIAESASTPSSAFPSILINAAGYVSTTPLEDTTLEETRQHFDANLLGPLLVSQAFAKLYWNQAQNRHGNSERAKTTTTTTPPGRIVSISSQAAHVALPNHGAYCASKAGLMGLTRCMASEWGGRGITANTVSPTVALTALGKKAWADPEAREKMFAQIPTGRFAEPGEIAKAIVFLCGDDAGMINGADVRIDGGFTIQ